MGSNLIRAEGLRLAKSLYGYACVAGFAALTLAMVMGNADVMAMGNEVRSEVAGVWAITPFEAYDLGFLMSGTAVVFAGWMISELVGGDYRTGAVKNLVQTQGGRRAYATMVMVFVVVASALMVAVGIGCAEVGCRFEGVALANASFGELVLWYVQATLCVAAYTMVTAWVVAATGSRAVGMTLALALGVGVFNTACNAVFEGLGVLAPSEGRYLPGSLGACVHALQGGALLDWTWVVPVAAVLVLGVVGVRRALGCKGLA